MYQYASKDKTQSEKLNKSTPSTNKDRTQIGMEIPLQTKSLFNPSLNVERDEKKASVNYTPRSAQITSMPYSSLQTQLMPKQKQNEIQPLPISRSENQNPIQSALNKPNHTGIPLQMKEKFENFSGFSFDDVKVHYNSGKPAQLQALAYTQGNQVYIGSGQERHLGHELGHVVQQKQGLVKATSKLNDIPINEDPVMEKNADVFSAIQLKQIQNITPYRVEGCVVQRMIFFSNGFIAHHLSNCAINGEMFKRTPTEEDIAQERDYSVATKNTIIKHENNIIKEHVEESRKENPSDKSSCKTDFSCETYKPKSSTDLIPEKLDGESGWRRIHFGLDGERLQHISRTEAGNNTKFTERSEKIEQEKVNKKTALSEKINTEKATTDFESRLGVFDAIVLHTTVGKGGKEASEEIKSTRRSALEVIARAHCCAVDICKNIKNAIIGVSKYYEADSKDLKWVDTLDAEEINKNYDENFLIIARVIVKLISEDGSVTKLTDLFKDYANDDYGYVEYFKDFYDSTYHEMKTSLDAELQLISDGIEKFKTLDDKFKDFIRNPANFLPCAKYGNYSG